MPRRPLALALALAALLVVAGTAWLVSRGGAARRAPPLPERGLTAVDIPPPRHPEVEGLRAFQRAGADRFAVEVTDEGIERRLRELLPFLRSPPRDAADLEARFPLALDLFDPAARTEPPASAAERPIHSAPGVEAFAGTSGAPPAQGPPAPALAGPLGLAREVARLIRPLTTLESAALKVVHIEGSAEGPAVAEVLYQLAGESPDGARRQWNGRWRLSFTRGLKIAAIVPNDATRAVLARRPFEDASAAALGRNPSYGRQLRPSLDFFRDTIDAATGIDVYGHHGIAVGDVDGDGREDLYLAEPPGLPNLLLRNRGDGSFADGSAGSGADLLDGVSQPLLLDLDGDGDQDLFLVGDDGVLVLKNDGRGTFTPHPSGVDLGGSARATTICAAAADFDLDGAVDVYVGSYVFWRGASNQLGSRLPLPYHDARNGAPNFLLRNLGDGTFRDVTRDAGLGAGNDRFTFAAAWGDYDDDGFPDLAVANDFGRKNLYRNRGDGTFEETTEAAGAADLGAGMSAAWEDYDQDGRLDLYFGNMFSTAGLRITTSGEFKAGSALRGDYRKHARGNTLLRNQGGGGFEDVSGPTRTAMGRWAWSSDFLDFDLDGREDLYIANGFVTAPESPGPRPDAPDL